MMKPCWIIYNPSIGALSTTEDGTVLLFQSERTARWYMRRVGAGKGDGFVLTPQRDSAVLIDALVRHGEDYMWVEEPQGELPPVTIGLPGHRMPAGRMLH